MGAIDNLKCGDHTLKLLPKFTGVRQRGRIKAVGNTLQYGSRILVTQLARIRDTPGQSQIIVRGIEPSEVAGDPLEILVCSCQVDD
jgi:hypothetical protein